MAKNPEAPRNPDRGEFKIKILAKLVRRPTQPASNQRAEEHRQAINKAFGFDDIFKL